MGASRMFFKLGRAMLQPIFAQQRRHTRAMNDSLPRALNWWLQVFDLDIVDKRSWTAAASAPIHLFCDASSSPAHLGVVAFIDNEILWSHMAPSGALLRNFAHREDKQIMGLELLAISLGLCTFGDALRGRKVVVYSDNSGSEVRERGVCSIPVCVVLVRYPCDEGLHARGTTRNLSTSSGSMRHAKAFTCT